MTQRPFQVIRISPTAKAGLKHQAFLLGYVKSITNRSHIGLSDYINAIASCKFEDTRPDEVREYHNELLAYGDVPNWSCEEYRPQTKFRLSPKAQLALYQYGLDHMIVNPRVIREHTPIVSVIGFMLEAIGIKWLTPIDPPRKVSHKQ